MPWNPGSPAVDQRCAFLILLTERSCSFAEACGRFGISRKTGYKWRSRTLAPQPQPLLDRCRRPHQSPRRSAAALEEPILAQRDLWGWGAKKIHAHGCQHDQPRPSVRTTHRILVRHRRVPLAGPPLPGHRFERSVPNDLGQIDYKGPLTVAGRSGYLLSVLDDHSRYALALRLCPDQTMAQAWLLLGELFGQAGLPGAILSDNGFAPRGPTRLAGGLSWLEARLMRLGIQTPHGRPYHPQTQGKVERWHRTLAEELLDRLPAGDAEAFAQQMEAWRTGVYNTERPHEALGNDVPARRWYASERGRPATLPAIRYAAGLETRKVMQKGEISWRGYEILAGSGLHGERVGVETQGVEAVLWYGRHELRRLSIAQLRRGQIN